MSILEEIVNEAMNEGNEFCIALLAKQVAIEKVPGGSDSACYGIRKIKEAIEKGSREILENLANAAITEAKGHNPFDEGDGDRYMMDSSVVDIGEELDALRYSSGPKQEKVAALQEEIEEDSEAGEDEDWDDALDQAY